MGELDTDPGAIKRNVEILSFLGYLEGECVLEYLEASNLKIQILTLFG